MSGYGEGLEECASDRRQGAYLGRYKRNVKERLTLYMRPQECGSRTAVRWAKLTDERGEGIEVLAPGTMEFSALPYSPFEIENATHTDEFPPSHRVWLCPALMRRGVGGDNSWGARTHPEYTLHQVPLKFAVALRPIR
ncbi:MAG: hypothetical protein Q4A71_07065 [Actinomycetaceae bacterium]|nr:hypothetical protein [Actinomycetaceae bacterium]